ncbi:MAG: YafY family transcriptional regulator [Defluviitaleaceae bacterium]|nr:YafY family transcriptional regulator [Defluviitaleaceae bacterium]
MQVNRLFDIIYILLNKKTATAKELAGRFNVSTRTIYRDVDTLSLAGIPIYTEKGKGGGISLLPDFVLNKSILSDREQDEILSALQGLSLIQSGDTGQVLQRLSGIFNKTATKWLEVDFSDWSFTGGEVFEHLKNAILERKIARFDYYSTYGEKTHRHIEPMQLWFKSRAWYIKGFCLAKQDMRLFKLSRIRNLTIAGDTFAERDLLAPRPAAEAAPRAGKDVALRLHISQEMTYRVLDEFADDMVEKQPDGSFMVNVTWPEDEWVYGYILSYGRHMKVLSPEYIQKIVKDEAQKIVAQYL